MIAKKTPHRIFDYNPRFYKPEDDEKEKRKKKLKFRTARKTSRNRRKSPILYLLIFIAILYFFLRFGGYLSSG